MDIKKTKPKNDSLIQDHLEKSSSALYKKMTKKQIILEIKRNIFSSQLVKYQYNILLEKYKNISEKESNNQLSPSQRFVQTRIPQLMKKQSGLNSSTYAKIVVCEWKKSHNTKPQGLLLPYQQFILSHCSKLRKNRPGLTNGEYLKLAKEERSKCKEHSTIDQLNEIDPLQDLINRMRLNGISKIKLKENSFVVEYI